LACGPLAKDLTTNLCMIFYSIFVRGSLACGPLAKDLTTNLCMIFYFRHYITPTEHSAPYCISILKGDRFH